MGDSRIGNTWIMPKVTLAAVTASGTTTATAWPEDLLDICLTVTTGTWTGTTPKMDLSLETSPDNGTTYFTVGRFLQLTATGVTNRLVLAFNAGNGNTASTTTNAGGGNNAVITSTQTNLSLCSGCPIVPAFMRFRYVLTATTPVLTATIWGWGNRLGKGIACP